MVSAAVRGWAGGGEASERACLGNDVGLDGDENDAAPLDEINRRLRDAAAHRSGSLALRRIHIKDGDLAGLALLGGNQPLDDRRGHLAAAKEPNRAVISHVVQKGLIIDNIGGANGGKRKRMGSLRVDHMRRVCDRQAGEEQNERLCAARSPPRRRLCLSLIHRPSQRKT